ncbi:MAG TPA: PhzF family phenazine biosynthesis protein [Polyangiales bacterium]|nr:PhzF family phenazine biosynthesis protein [Polyangiales bacterium]
MQTLRFILVDVFTDRALSGNQLAVFTDARKLDAATMQALARETNLAETVFVLPAQAEGHARIRIFTPARELPFAGHPTLGAAFVLGGPMQSNAVHLETGAGIIPVTLEREGPRIVFGWMVQPVPSFERFEPSAALLAALGVEASALPIERYHLGPSHVYVALHSPDEVAKLAPDLAALARVGDVGVNAFARTPDGWKTRMFAPRHGVNEDAATGSAAGPLAVHLTRHGWIRAGEEIRIDQGAEIGRPSRLYARVHGSAERIERVEVGGSAVIVGRGEFQLRNLP